MAGLGSGTNYIPEQNATSIEIEAKDSPSIDAFGRLRVSDPYTIFDSKQIGDSTDLFWDDAQTSGSGTSTSHDPDEAAVTISVGATTAGTRVRQTFQRFNYQPGKSHLIFFTWSEFDTSTGITKNVGYYDDENGIFFKSEEGTVSVVRRSYVTGSAVDTSISQASWNLDTMDGNGTSGVDLDFTKTQIGIIDFEWLGVGRVRIGFVIDGVIIYCHQFLNANSLTTVYMSTPNLPVRYEISNDGSGSADDFVHICASVQSEGGQDKTGMLRYFSTAATHIDCNTAGTIYAIVGIRLKSDHLGAMIDIERIAMINETNDDYEWILILNPTLANSVTFNGVTNSCVETAVGESSNPSLSTVTGGTQIDGGYVSAGGTSGSIIVSMKNALRLGAAIDGTVDEIYLCCRPLTNGADIQGGINWREKS